MSARANLAKEVAAALLSTIMVCAMRAAAGDAPVAETPAAPNPPENGISASTATAASVSAALPAANPPGEGVPAATTTPAVVSAAPLTSRPTAAAFDRVLRHVEIGTRITGYRLRDRKRAFDAGVGDTPGSFYGSINQLDAEQDYLPLKLFVDYRVNPYCGLELTYDQLRVRTITQIDGHTDGRINLVGPMASVFGRYPNATRLTPYAGFGVAYFFAWFDENPQWEDPPGRGEHQTMDFDNTWGSLVYLGCDVKVSGPWSADVLVRYTKVDVHGTHWLNGDKNEIGGQSPNFPLSNLAVGLGVRYRF